MQRVIVVEKRTPYRRYVEEEADPRARLLLKKRDPSVAHWLNAHREHERTLEAVLKALDGLGARSLVLHRPRAVFDTTDAALVVSVGGDGTLLAASHNVASVPVLGVNSAPKHSVGFFCAAERKTARRMLADALEGALPHLSLTRMRVAVNGRVRSQRVLNEVLFSHCSPAATSRYYLRHGRVGEEHRSSGFWIGPAAGSTAAQRSAGGRILPLGSQRLQLVVREPYVPFGGAYRLLKLIVEPGSRVLVRSMMQDACMFLDGPFNRVDVRLGDRVTFDVSDEPLTLLGLRARRHRS